MNECITYVQRNLLIARSAPDFSLSLLLCTGKSLSEALIFASTNPQYDDRLLIELQVQYMKLPSSELAENMLST